MTPRRRKPVEDYKYRLELSAELITTKVRRKEAIRRIWQVNAPIGCREHAASRGLAAWAKCSCSVGPAAF